MVSIHIPYGTPPVNPNVELKERDLHYCGGVIISPNFILTAAHCIFEAKDFRLMIGSNGLWFSATDSLIFKPEEDSHSMNRTTKRWIKIHDNYRVVNNTQVNDIALIKTDRPMEFRIENGQFMSNSVCLPEQSDKQPEGWARISGWGFTRLWDPTSKPLCLQSIDSLIIDNNRCGQLFRQTRYYSPFGDYYVRNNFDPGSQFCTIASLAPGAASEWSYKGPAPADSGSPYVQYSDDRATLVGLLSGGDHEVHNPALKLTQVSKFRQWIELSVKQSINEINYDKWFP
ncbi:U21-ctenitoxin-Pn1a-like [Oppia nitens]|uniref:U21-ctenitoxin-Pn1a-like n=1 Tax=Oppia nitens TaxID=1686743 RepID=UPI0023DCB79D|nr:U21-ctenitoxin-Pn1a-like [Oppia nitens]